MPAVLPVGRVSVRADAPVRLVPVRVTATVLPRMPVVGLMAVTVGPSTVKETVPLVPPAVVTLRVPEVAVLAAVTAMVAVICVLETTTMFDAVTPFPTMFSVGRAV